MTSFHPVIRHVIACEDIQTSPINPRQVTLVNLVGSIQSIEVPPYPLLYQELCFFVQLSGCRGPAQVEIRIVHEVTGHYAYSGPATPWTAALPTDPVEVVGLPFRISNIEFLESGPYSIEFWYNGKAIAREPLDLR